MSECFAKECFDFPFRSDFVSQNPLVGFCFTKSFGRILFHKILWSDFVSQNPYQKLAPPPNKAFAGIGPESSICPGWPVPLIFNI
jgi:hypothetical protein